MAELEVYVEFLATSTRTTSKTWWPGLRLAEQDRAPNGATIRTRQECERAQERVQRFVRSAVLNVLRPFVAFKVLTTCTHIISSPVHTRRECGRAQDGIHRIRQRIGLVVLPWHRFNYITCESTRVCGCSTFAMTSASCAHQCRRYERILAEAGCSNILEIWTLERPGAGAT